MHIESFKEIASNYKIIVFDAYGVLKKEGGVIAGVPQMIQDLSDQQKPFFLLTNDSSISPERISKGYQNYGIPQMKVQNIVSSGMSTQYHMTQVLQKGSNVLYIGQKYASHYVTEAGMNPISICNYDANIHTDISAVVMLDHTSFIDFENIKKMVNILRDLNPQVFVANTDLIYPVSDDEFSVAVGAYAKMFESITEREFENFAKPSAKIFTTLYEIISKKHPEVKKHEILMVGDTLDTDILGANNFGFSSCLTLSGSTKKEDADHRIMKKQIFPTHICQSVAE